MLTRKTRPWLRNFVIKDAKRLLQHYLRIKCIAAKLVTNVIFAECDAASRAVDKSPLASLLALRSG
jgi:hypothetical protein